MRFRVASVLVKKCNLNKDVSYTHNGKRFCRTRRVLNDEPKPSSEFDSPYQIHHGTREREPFWDWGATFKENIVSFSLGLLDRVCRTASRENGQLLADIYSDRRTDYWSGAVDCKHCGGARHSYGDGLRVTTARFQVFSLVVTLFTSYTRFRNILHCNWSHTMEYSST